jgi:hypothetical protein
VIVAYGYELAFDEAVKQMRRFYKSRSKFVHEGKAPAKDDVDSLHRINEAVLFALLRIRRFSANATNFDKSEWHKRLDFIASALGVGAKLKHEDVAPAGLV